MIQPIILLGLGAAGLLLFFSGGRQRIPGTTRDYNGENVINVRGRRYIVELVGKKGLQASYILKKPASPPIHAAYPILQFAQLGDSPARQLVAKFPSVPANVFKQAMLDLAITDPQGLS